MTYRAPLDDILFALRLAAGEGAIEASETTAISPTASPNRR